MLKEKLLPADTFVVLNKTVLNDQDRKILTMLYQPIIGSNSISLFFTLWSYLDKLELMSIECTHHHLMMSMRNGLEEIIEAREKLREAKREALVNSCNIKVGRRELEISLKALEKVSRLKEIAKEIKSYDDILYMYEGDKIDLQLLKYEVFEIIQEL